jgi:phage terminase Nu1 subunit (DNA packaging protein)
MKNSTGETISKAEFARREKVSKTVVSKWVRAGLPTAGGGQIDPEAARAWLKANTSRGVTVESLTEARSRKESALADLRELELARLRGETVLVEDVGHVLDSAIATSRVRLLAVPQKVAPELALEDNPVKCQELVRAAIHEALHELASGRLQEAAPGGAKGRKGDK